ncbi:NADH dehydrogenase [ubiquinone] 1 beta subcomplex subunit 4, partial [Colius striatus]
ENPALIRWDYARTHNVYPTFRLTPKTVFLGAVCSIGPLLFWGILFKVDR